MNVTYKHWDLSYQYNVENKIIEGTATPWGEYPYEPFRIEVPADSLHEAYSKSKLNTLEHLFKQKVDKRIEE